MDFIVCKVRHSVRRHEQFIIGCGGIVNKIYYYYIII